jgi:NAD(P)-dependent dehydrogenase (short-subunit alcohol dehydrogenase family)
MGKLTGKVAVIFGASSGIGQATAILFAAEGAKVVIAARSLAGLESTVKTIRERGGTALAVPADVTLTADVQNVFNQAVSQYGKLDILFNNAGIEQPYNLLHELSEETWDKVINTNLKGVFLGMKYGIPHMLKNGGVIINTGSPASLVGQPFSPAYCASKAGIVGLTRAAAFDYAPQNIRVNCLCPGGTATPLLERARTGPEWEKRVAPRWTKRSPLGRVAKPEEIARAVLFLACDDSSVANGAILAIDGGYTAY